MSKTRVPSVGQVAAIQGLSEKWQHWLRTGPGKETDANGARILSVMYALGAPDIEHLKTVLDHGLACRVLLVEIAARDVQLDHATAQGVDIEKRHAATALMRVVRQAKHLLDGTLDVVPNIRLVKPEGD